MELRDARADEAQLAEARKLSPLRTLPVLVDEGRVIGDSSAIAQYLDLAYPDRPVLWPRGADAAHDALAITSGIDVAMNTLVDMGTRNWELRSDPNWPNVLRERMARAQGAIELVASKATRRAHLAGDAWSVADMWTFAATKWIHGMPARAATAPLVAQILTLGFRLPEALVTWAKQHEGRGEVQAIYS